jgi:5-methyltetrahydrofolate--homocysteine methyltransferase
MNNLHVHHDVRSSLPTVYSRRLNGQPQVNHANSRELGFAADEARDPEAMLNQGYHGSRYSFGYPACPNLADQQQLLALLGAEEIGISLSEEDQLDPEQSTSAIVVHHPQAKYFSV